MTRAVTCVGSSRSISKVRSIIANAVEVLVSGGVCGQNSCMGFANRGAALAAVVIGVVANAGGVNAEQGSALGRGQVIRLTDVIAVAVRQSPDLARAKLDLATAQAQLLQAQGITDTHVTVQAQVTRDHGGDRDPFGNDDTEQVSASVTHPLSTGGTLTLTMAGDPQPQQVRHGHTNGPA